MTDSYNQENINLRDAAPISVQTPDGAAVSFLIDTLTADGQVLIVDMYGGGADADPTLVTTNTYSVLTGSASFGRAGGAGAVVPAIALAPAGVVPALTFTVIDVLVPAPATQCFLTITPGGVTPYNHRLKVSKIRF